MSTTGIAIEKNGKRYCKVCGTLIELDEVKWKLRFLWIAMLALGASHADFIMEQEECSGMAAILWEISDEIRPEHDRQPDSEE